MMAHSSLCQTRRVSRCISELLRLERDVHSQLNLISALSLDRNNAIIQHVDEYNVCK